MTAARTYLIAAGLAGSLVLAGALPALADSTPTPSTSAGATAKACSAARLTFIKARVDLATSRRYTEISKLTSHLSVRPHVTSDDRATLTNLYASDRSGLGQVDATVQADTTCASAVSDGKKIVTDFRIYLLVAPQTHLTVASDSGTWGTSQLMGAEPALQKAIDAIPTGANKTQAQSLYNDAVSKVSTAQSNFAGVSAAALALTPAGYPGNAPTLNSLRSKVLAGTSALQSAVQDAKQIRGLVG
jgi:hypothetical protein